jgi:hypothetical protein
MLATANVIKNDILQEAVYLYKNYVTHDDLTALACYTTKNLNKVD